MGGDADASSSFFALSVSGGISSVFLSSFAGISFSSYTGSGSFSAGVSSIVSFYSVFTTSVTSAYISFGTTTGSSRGFTSSLFGLLSLILNFI